MPGRHPGSVRPSRDQRWPAIPECADPAPLHGMTPLIHKSFRINRLERQRKRCGSIPVASPPFRRPRPRPCWPCVVPPGFGSFDFGSLPARRQAWPTIGGSIARTSPTQRRRRGSDPYETNAARSRLVLRARSESRYRARARANARSLQVLAHGTMRTVTPSPTHSKSCSTSPFRIRTQPFDDS